MSTDWHELLIAGVVAAQADSIVAREIAVELLLRQVQDQPDPRAMLHEMFAAISALIDVRSDNARDAMGDAREIVDAIFTAVDRRLQGYATATLRRRLDRLGD